jgi:ribokinase
MRDADILTPNQGEARVLLGLEPDDPSDDRDICARLLDLGAATVVLTRGRDGALVVTPGGTETVSAFPVEVVDSTGAGDAFTGTLAAALAAGRSLSEAARRAAAAGALACTRLGVVPSLPYADDVDRMTEGVT